MKEEKRKYERERDWEKEKSAMGVEGNTKDLGWNLVSG